MSSTTITDLDFGWSFSYDPKTDSDHIHYTASKKVEEETSPKTKDHDADIVTISNNSYSKDATPSRFEMKQSPIQQQEEAEKRFSYAQTHSLMGNDIEDIYDNILEDAHHILTSHTDSMKQKMVVSNALMSLSLQTSQDFHGNEYDFLDGISSVTDDDKLTDVMWDKDNYFYGKDFTMNGDERSRASPLLEIGSCGMISVGDQHNNRMNTYGELVKTAQQQLKTPEQQELYEIYTNNMIAGAVAGNGGISSLDIHVKEITNHTDKGDETSYQFSFSQSAQTAQGQEAAPALMDPTEGFAPTQEYRNSWLQYVEAGVDDNPWDGSILNGKFIPTNQTDRSETELDRENASKSASTKASGSLYSSTVDENGDEAGIEASMRYDEYQAKLGQEIIDELFGGTKSASKEASKNNQINTTKEAQIKTAKELHLQASFSYSKNTSKGATATNKIV